MNVLTINMKTWNKITYSIVKKLYEKMSHFLQNYEFSEDKWHIYICISIKWV